MSERYKIKGKLGSGGVGTVYRAFDTQLKREVAVKRLLPQEDRPEEARKTAEYLIKEAGMLSKLQHPNIVNVYDVGIDDDGGYVVMELIDGETLNQTIKRGALTLRDFSEVVEQSLEGMICAQDIGMLHRDLKPSNVMIRWLPSGSFQLKLLDFGLAKVSEEPSLQTLDHGNSILGSIYFMSPEQLERERLDGRTDIYSLGCLFYYCLAGRFPFTGDSAAQVMVAHLEHAVEPLSGVRPDIPTSVSDFVMKMISRDREDRPENATEALEAFVAIRAALSDEAFKSQPGAASAEDKVTQSTPVPTPRLVTGTTPQPNPSLTTSAHFKPPLRRKNRGWLWPVAISAVTLIIVAFVVFHDPSEATVNEDTTDPPPEEPVTKPKPKPPEKKDPTPPPADGSGKGRPLVAFNSEWKYHPPGSSPPKQWTNLVFDDSAWPKGKAPIGYGDAGLATTIDISGAMQGNRKPATLHFRHEFKNDNANFEGHFAVQMRLDDGAIIYLNGKEVRRIGMRGGGKVGNDTLSVRNVQNKTEQQLVPIAIPRKHLRLGRNVLAIRLHQCDRTSSDAHFDLQMRPWGGVHFPAPRKGARDFVEVVPTSRDSPVEWSYRFQPPSPSWLKENFKEAPNEWKKGPGIFASTTFPKFKNAQRTVWDKKNVWLRRSFELTEEQLAAKKHLAFSVLHDDDIHIYLNGALAASRWPSCNDYIVLPIDDQARKKLKVGKNILAVHCLNGSREQAVDVGIIRLNKKK